MPLYVDSVIVHGLAQKTPDLRGTTLQMVERSFPDPAEEPSQFMCAISHLIPFIMWDQPPRGNLAVQMFRQGLCTGIVRGDADFVARNRSS